MKMVKRVLLLILSTDILTGMCGCIGFNRQSYSDVMVEYLNEKYDDDEFEYLSPFGGGAGASYKQIICSSEKYPDEEVSVLFDIDEDGNKIIKDNYLAIKYKEQVIELLDKILTECFETDHLLFYDVNMYSFTDNSTQDTTFEEFISTASSYITFTAVINSEYEVDRDYVERIVQKKFVENGFCCRIGVIYFDGGTGSYDGLESTELSGYGYRKDYKECFDFDMETNEYFSKSKWREK